MRNNTINELNQLLKISSVTDDIIGVNAIGKKLQFFLKDIPLRWEHITYPDSANFLVARSNNLDTSKPVILLSGHTDVVYPPFQISSAQENVKKLFGSGTQDMKGGLMVIVETVRKLHAHGILKNIILVFNPEEEHGRTAQFKKVMMSIAREANFIMVFESTQDNLIDNNLKTRSVVIERKGIYVATVTLKTSGGHAGTIANKSKRHNAINYASNFILDLDKLSNYRTGTTINVGKIQGGDAFNIIAPEVKFVFEVRFRTLPDFNQFKLKFDTLVFRYKKNDNLNTTLEEKGPLPPLRISTPNKKFLHVVQAVAKKLGITLYVEKRGGRSDACWFQKGNPNAAILDGFGVKGGYQHTKREYLLLESIDFAVQFATETIRKILKYI